MLLLQESLLQDHYLACFKKLGLFQQTIPTLKKCYFHVIIWVKSSHMYDELKMSSNIHFIRTNLMGPLQAYCDMGSM